MKETLETLRRHRALSSKLTRGNLPEIYTQTRGNLIQALRYAAMGAICVGFL